MDHPSNREIWCSYVLALYIPAPSEAILWTYATWICSMAPAIHPKTYQDVWMEGRERDQKRFIVVIVRERLTMNLISGLIQRGFSTWWYLCCSILFFLNSNVCILIVVNNQDTNIQCWVHNPSQILMFEEGLEKYSGLPLIYKMMMIATSVRSHLK